MIFFFTTLRKIATHPALFFNGILKHPSYRLSSVLAFALVCHWIAMLFHSFYEPARNFSHFFIKTGAVLGDPFWTLSSLFINSFLVFVGARLILGSDRIVFFEEVLILVSLSYSSCLFLALPQFGGLLTGFTGVFLLVVAVRESFQTTIQRAFIIALFPPLFWIATALAFGGMMTGWAVKLLILNLDRLW